MTENLKANLKTKHTLRFNPDGRFKVVMMSDLQEPLNYDRRSLTAMDGIIKAEKPDLVMLGGDNCGGIQSPEELRQYLDIFAAPMENRRIPWAHIFGNHDYDLPFDKDLMQTIYESYPYCVSKRTPKGISGITNFVLPVKAFGSEKIIFNIWGIDTNNRIRDMDNFYHGRLEEDSDLPNRFAKTRADYDIIRFDQIMWYWNSSLELEAYNNGKIHALMCMHIGLYELMLIQNNPKETRMTGESNEQLDPGAFNSGMFAAVLQRGDVVSIACGHTHCNTLEGIYCGIKLSFAGCMGFSPYGIDRLRGARVFEISEGNPADVRSRMVYARDFL